MIHNQRHEMHLEKTHPSGAEEWECPTCGRRFLLRWPPAYKKIVLEPGDEYAVHTGGKHGLQTGPIDMIASEVQDAVEDNLDAWQEGLQDVDLDL